MNSLAECRSCKGTGIYVGFAEENGAGVVCSRCRGQGFKELTWEPFEGRKERKDVVRVYRTNPGIRIGENDFIRLTDFGGMSYKKWLETGEFPLGSEDRQHTCPAWFYQFIGKKPDWKKCDCLGGRFFQCRHFDNKDQCWKEWDDDNRMRG